MKVVMQEEVQINQIQKSQHFFFLYKIIKSERNYKAKKKKASIMYQRNL